MEIYEFIVEENHVHLRIDKVLNELLEDVTRSRIQKLIDDNCVTVNDEVIKSNYKVRLNDKILVKFEEPKEYDVVAENLNLDIVYEDSDLLVVNKPRGMVVHPAVGNVSKTLVNGLLYHCKDLSGINGVMRPGIVHRIDKDTSGLLVVAKNDRAHEFLSKQMSEKTVTRKYVALCHGVIEHDFGTIDAPIGRDCNDRQKMMITDKNSRHAVTHFKVIERFDRYTLIECSLETGRTHQIRVHMKYIGYPIVGDPKYGQRKTLNTDGQLLHAQVLGFIHPTTKEYLEFSSDIPEIFKNVLEELRTNRSV